MNSNGNHANAKAPYEELDGNIVSLVRALNSFEGIQTIGSWVEHPNTKPDHNPEGSWDIIFDVGKCEHGWFALEFLTWFINNKMFSEEHSVLLLPDAIPPFLNIPGEVIFFSLTGGGVDPDWLAKELLKGKEEFFISPEDFEAEELFEGATV
jgi:hypothetical protein